MIQLLIIADDLTGALDAGVKFASAGMRVQVFFENTVELSECNADIAVLAYPTRHLSPEKAYITIKNAAEKAFSLGITKILKKTDSGLRGNIGAELTALLDAHGKQHIIPFLPALPEMNRITKNGVQYIDNVPVSKSVFGNDTYAPVRYDGISDILNTTCQTETIILQPEEKLPECERNTIAVYNIETQEQMMDTCKKLAQAGALDISAGCSGIAAAMAELINGGNKCAEKSAEKRQRMAVICGSTNPITKNQLCYAWDTGFAPAQLNEKQLLTKNYFSQAESRPFLDGINTLLRDSKYLAVGTSLNLDEQKTDKDELETMRLQISENLGAFIAAVARDNPDVALVISGGDTLLAFMNTLEAKSIMPYCELEPGVILSQIQLNGQVMDIVSKSGGFGKVELFVELREELCKKLSV